MANSTSKLPLFKRIQDAVDKIGTSNGTRIPDPVLPADIDQKNNAAVNDFFEKHELVEDFYFLDVIMKHVEGQHRAQKKKLIQRFNINEDTLIAGDNKTFTFDNMNLTQKVTNGRGLLNRELLQVILMSQLDKMAPGCKNLSLEETNRVIEAATRVGKPPLSLIPATTAE